jgi:hypothetical protein
MMADSLASTVLYSTTQRFASNQISNSKKQARKSELTDRTDIARAEATVSTTMASSSNDGNIDEQPIPSTKKQKILKESTDKPSSTRGQDAT